MLRGPAGSLRLLLNGKLECHSEWEEGELDRLQYTASAALPRSATLISADSVTTGERTGTRKGVKRRGATLLLACLICGDLAFVVLHYLNGLTPVFDNPLLSLERDRGFPEMYQYMKFFWIIIILIFVSFRYAAVHYASWALVFAYLLLDDSLEIHETVGRYVAANTSLVPALGLRIEDYGELAVTAAVGIVLFLPLVWAYWKGSRIFRKVSHDFALLILLLVFFGVVVDMARIVFTTGWRGTFILGVTEEGGEMMSVSVMLAYAFLIAVRDESSGYYLSDCVRNLLPRRST